MENVPFDGQVRDFERQSFAPVEHLHLALHLGFNLVEILTNPWSGR
jgi:hypothetical protein